jgi:hypothetical protein
VGLLALGAVVGAALLIVLSQPIRSPWWIYADSDASYVSSSANLMGGRISTYLDHPGLPLQDLMAATFEVRRLVSGGGSPAAYAKARILHLDDSRAYWRTYAGLFFVFGAVLLFAVCTSLFGHWGFGLAGGLLWLGAPELAQLSIRYAPDVLLCALSVLVAFVLVRAAEGRRAFLFAAAAFLLGLTVTVKVHAVGLLVPFVVALALGWPRGDGASLRTDLGRAARRFRYPLIALGVVWLAFATEFNVRHWPIHPSRSQLGAAMLAIAAVGGYAAVSWWADRSGRSGLRRVFHPLVASLVVAFAIGVALPATVFVDTGLRMLVTMANTLLGRAVNQNVHPFHVPWGQFGQFPLAETLPAFALAAVALVLGAWRRDLRPLLFASGTLATGAMAVARLGTVHYFAPAYVLAVPAALWLLLLVPRPAAVAVGATLVAVVLVPQLQHLNDNARAADGSVRQSVDYERLGKPLLRPGQVALVDVGSPLPDSLYAALVEEFIVDPPPYPGQRFLEDTSGSLTLAQAQGLRMRYYVGGMALGVRNTEWLQLGSGLYLVRRVPHTRADGVGVLRLLRRR